MNPTETAEPAAEPVNRLGQVIAGRYLIQRLLGEGGMGAVYLAEHTQMNKLVALKLLHQELSEDAEVAARFEREAMAAAHIVHPNVAGATDFGKTDDGVLFLVLEYVEGTSLRDVLLEKDAPLSVARSLRITRQVARAIECAHEAGIVHRDLKPENVMLVKKADEPDFVKVLDFGIAKVLEGAAQQAAEAIAKRNGGAPQQLTRIGTILGTPEYMAPEQALGEAITPATDLYGLGVMFYEMLTGKHPFETPDRMAMISYHVVAPVPTMRERAPNRDIPAQVEAIARCLLEKDSKKRYPTSRALIEAIDVAATAHAIDVGASPSAIPSQPVPSGGQLPNAPRFLHIDSPLRRFVEKVLRLPRPALVGMAAAAPLGFVLVMVVSGLRSRGGSGAGAVTDELESGTQSVHTVASPELVSAAAALGPEALEDLSNSFPRDASLLSTLAVAYAAAGKSADALRAVRAVLAASPGAMLRDDVLQVVVVAAAAGQGGADNDAFALLEGPLGEKGVDVLIELSAKTSVSGGRELRARASKALAKVDVREHASPAALIALDMKAASLCSGKRDLLARARESGDARVLTQLKLLKQTTGCGGWTRRDCWACLRKDSILDESIAAVETRAAAK